jgi:hypothetical protein
MSELDSRIKWKATGVHGHTWETLDGYLYTSDIPPVEAEEYDRVFQRAQELEAKLDAVPVDAIRAIYDSVPVDNWTRKPLRAIREWLAAQGKQVHP